MRKLAGVMEQWSNGVLKELIQVETEASALSSTPILQHSIKRLFRAKPRNRHHP